MKHKINLIQVGHVSHLVDFQKIKQWKSDLFEVTGIDCIEHLPDSDIEDGYLDIKYTLNKLKLLLDCPVDADYAIAIMPYRFEDNFYMHRISNNCVVISLFGIVDILQIDNIAVEHFIIKQLYEICAIKHILNDIASDDVYQFIHRDTRGCLFDMNGERSDIIYNIERPIICEECKGKFKTKQIKTEILSTFEKELKRIHKPLILRLERYIKKYPFASLLLSVLTAILINVIANLICELLNKGS